VWSRTSALHGVLFNEHRENFPLAQTLFRQINRHKYDILPIFVATVASNSLALSVYIDIDIPQSTTRHNKV
jgi:hypothetical protein